MGMFIMMGDVTAISKEIVGLGQVQGGGVQREEKKKRRCRGKDKRKVY